MVIVIDGPAGTDHDHDHERTLLIQGPEIRPARVARTGRGGLTARSGGMMAVAFRNKTILPVLVGVFFPMVAAMIVRGEIYSRA